MPFEIWENFTSGILDYGISAYNAVEPWTIPLVFLGIIGWVYASVHSVTVTAVAILITFSIYGSSILLEVPDSFSIFLYIVTILGITFLFTALAIKYRGG